MGSIFGPVRFLLPVCRLSWFLYTLNIYAHFSSHFSQQLLMAEIWLNGKINILIYLPAICTGYLDNFNTCIVNSFHNCYLYLCIGSLPLTMVDFGILIFGVCFILVCLILILSWEITQFMVYGTLELSQTCNKGGYICPVFYLSDWIIVCTRWKIWL